MSKNPLVLTFDIGTQSARAMLVNKKGEIIAKKQKHYKRPYFSLNSGWAEQKPYFYWEAICEISLALKNENKDIWPDIIALTCTCIRDTCLCIGKDGEPLRDVILWLDSREAEDIKPLNAANKIAYKMVGQLKVAESVRRSSPCNWIRQYEPEIWKKTKKFVFISAFFNYMFTGKLIDCTANIIGHIPYNVKTSTWSRPYDLKYNLFPVEREKLCDLVSPGKLIGKVSQKAANETGIPKGLPMIATGSDKGCETMALTSLNPSNTAALSFGTTATIQVSSNKYFEILPFVPPFPGVSASYNPELEIYRGYWLISWFKKEFAEKEVAEAEMLGVSPEDLLNKRLKEVPPGCDGLLLQPYFTPGINMPNAKGSMIGFSDVHTRIHLYRAIIEGINFGLMEGLHLIEKRGKLNIESLYVTGGGAQSDEILQITSNMFGLPVYKIHTHEACGVGSSMFGFIANGTYINIKDAAENMIHIKKVYKPNLTEHKIYKKLYDKIYSKVFDRLTPLYKDLNHILKSIIETENKI